MRAVIVAGLLAFLYPAAVIAQTPAPPTSPPPGAPVAAPASPSPRSARGGDIAKDEYIERARRAAERRFDRMDLNHDGVLTADERRAAREARGSRRRAPASR
jgi:hypothetical protein